MPAEPNETVLPLAAETLRIETVARETGRVHVSVTTETVEEMVSATLRGRSATLERVPMDQEVAEAPQTREEGGVLIIPVLEERLVVEKRLFLKEEIRVRFHDTEEKFEQSVQRRVEVAVINRSTPEDTDI